MKRTRCVLIVMTCILGCMVVIRLHTVGGISDPLQAPDKLSLAGDAAFRQGRPLIPMGLPEPAPVAVRALVSPEPLAEPASGGVSPAPNASCSEGPQASLRPAA